VTTFVDTSALYALLDRDDDNHRAAASWFQGSDSGALDLLTHSYVVIESTALIHHRLGMGAARALLEDVVPAMTLVLVDESLHRAGVSAYLAARSAPSLVDRVSFELMRHRGIAEAFAFDRDFEVAGFSTVP
jgi:predicted nucleic acid-binding protein